MTTTQQDRMMSISTPLGDDYLLINKLSATEALSELFKFDVELLHEETEAGHEPTIVDIQEILGQNVAVTVAQRDGTTRIFNGIVKHFSQGNRDERFSYYYATIVPHVWLLTQNFQSRIFQQITVPDILKQVFDGFNVSWEIQGTFNPRNYCVQYRETDFAFASRLMEEEGIYYYFEHTDEGHKMIVADGVQSHRDCPSKSEIPCFLEVTPDEDWVGSVGTWRVDYKLQSGKVTLWDQNFQLPQKKLEAEQPALVSIGGNDALEIYDFPAGYGRKYDGIAKDGGEQASDLQHIFEDNKKTAKTRMQEIDAQYKTFSGMSDCCALTAGYRFKLFNHPNTDFNVQHTLVSVTHEIEQSPDYVSDEEVSNSYGNSFTCIMHGGNNPPFRPPQKTPKPIIQGTQTAFVVGPAGEEIFTDKYGRVKVQFHWDREGQVDANSSCWVRVAQAWAGNRWGMMFIPRIGMEAVIDFTDGDPDQPIITGCVYNAQAMPPYTLPDEKTKMTIKSDSSKGGQGFNELRFEDKKGSEQVFIHGEKDLDVRIKNDRREWTGNDQHLIVKYNRREKIGGDTHLLVGGDQVEKIEGSQHFTINSEQRGHVIGNHSVSIEGDSDEIVLGKKALSADQMLFLRGQDVVVKALSSITLTAGGSHIVIDASGVYIKGAMVHINSSPGSPQSGQGQATPPDEPAVADTADDAKPGTIIELQKRSALRKKEKKHKEDENKKSWIKIKMVDEEGKPVPGVRYRITTPEGRVKSGSLNKNGQAHVKGFDPGSCKVTFPELDQEAWEDA
jgi:type VI secretion system secreted protein VgrG